MNSSIHTHGSATGYETRDASVGLIVASAIILAVGIVACLVVAGLLMRDNLSESHAAAPELVFQHGTAEESSIVRDWRAQDAAVRDHLDHYAWQDRDAGFVRIPISRAMEILAAENAGQPAKGAR